MGTLDNEFVKFGRVTFAICFRNLRQARLAGRGASLAKDGENNPWDALEGEFYGNPEDLEAMIVEFIARNQAEFGA
jgi:hypothetical protein